MTQSKSNSRKIPRVPIRNSQVNRMVHFRCEMEVYNGETS